jgi:hypothetical protein
VPAAQGASAAARQAKLLSEIAGAGLVVKRCLKRQPA